MDAAKTAKVFKNGNSQAVRIPKEFYVPDDELLIQKIGGTILLSPKTDPWQLFRKSLDEFSEDFFKEGRNQPDTQTRETIFQDTK